MPLLHNCVYRIPYALTRSQGNIWKKKSKCIWNTYFVIAILLIGTRLPACAIQRQLRTKSHHATKYDTPSLELHMPYFDAERFAMLLEKEGFSASQSRAVINALDDVVDER